MAAWATDMALIYFVYGAAFLFLGVSILRQPRLAHDCRLAGIIPLLGLFGLLHGVNEWLDFLRVIRGGDPLLDAVRTVVLPVSFLPLLEFGRRLMQPRLSRWTAPWMLALPLGVVGATAIASNLSVEHTLLASRYALALPGGLLTGAGLLQYARTAEPWVDTRRVRIMLATTGTAFILYAVLAGLVVPPLDVPLARHLNSGWFTEQTGLPVQLFRALCAVVAGLAIWQVLTAFDRERVRNLHALADEAARRNQEHRLILDATAEGIVGLDGRGRVSFSNQSASALLGYPPEGLHGANLHELVHVHADGRPHPAEDCGIARLLQTGGRFSSSDQTFRRADGSLFPVELNAAALLDAQGAPAGAVVSFRDISTRRARTAQLRLRTRALEAAREGIMIHDASHPGYPMIYANPGFTAITGYPVEEGLGGNLAFLQRDDRDQPGLAQLRELLSRGESGVVILRNYRKDGTRFWNELHVAPVRDDAGCISHYVGIMNDISERVAYQEELERHAHHDALTGLANRVLLNAHLDQILAQARRREGIAAVLFIDLDQFKLINDGLGHSQGDVLLKEIALRLRDTVRETDTVARLGGDEFVIVLAEPAQDDEAAEVAQRVLDMIAQPVQVGERELFVTASIGAALFPRDGSDGEALLSNADAAMYRAKSLGRNQFQYWSAALNARVGERLELLGQLRGAIERGELRLHYQPQVSLPDGHISGVEALVRWQHPKLGLVPPAHFIPLAEDSGLIEPIGEWVLFEACRQAVEWDHAGVAPIRMSVNVSARQFANPQLDKLVQAVLNSTGLAPQRLELELTETALMADPELSAVRLDAIRKLGVQLALDDFGTGYSSLGYLKRFAFDRLKIDRSFVTDAIRDPDDTAIVRTVIAMARMMGMHTIAEGTELAETVSYLGRQGCDEVQGYFVAKPLPADTLASGLLRGVRVEKVAALFGEEAQRTLLVLDDDQDTLHALRHTLRSCGWRVFTTSDPEEAFALLARHTIQVVMSDQHLPRMGGTELLRRIKELYPHSIRIVLSAHTDPDSISTAINRGSIYKFLTKPWDDAVLIDALQQAFERHDATAPLENLEHAPAVAPAATRKTSRTC
ncbi:MAG: EAL domain-containing protein [Gammaproteobacteria bacterium]